MNFIIKENCAWLDRDEVISAIKLAISASSEPIPTDTMCSLNESFVYNFYLDEGE
jgi:hypothetical protein